MSSEKHGFTGKVTEHKAGLYLRIPDNTVISASLSDKDLLHLKLRNIRGETVEVTREVQESRGQVKVYLPKQVKEDLQLEHKDLVDVFFSKD